MPRPAPDNLRGAAWMVLVGFGFAIVPVSVRYLTDTLHVFEILLLRNAVALLPVVPIVMRSGWGVLRTRQIGSHMVRAGFNYMAMLTYFWGIQVVLLADAVSIQFLIPILTALGAVALLGEKVGWRRWLVCGIGVLGAMLIVRPGFQEVSLHTASVLVSAVFYTGAWLMVKKLTGDDSATAIVFYLNLCLLVVSAIPAALVWTDPTWHDVPGIVALGIGGWVAHFGQARAFAVADVSAMVPLDFLRLPFVVAFGYLLFAQMPDAWTWSGGAIIIAAATYLARSESRASAAPARG